MEEHPIIDRPTTIEVNLASLQHNVGQIKKHCGSDKKVMAIIKANAYGHGLIPIGVALEKMGGVDYLGVAFLEEGIALRRANVRLPILVLGGIYKPQIGTFLDFDLELTVSSLEKLRQVEEIARAYGRPAAIHLKIDTGMERVGVHSESAGPFIAAAVNSSFCTIKGVYSHLACADDPNSPMTILQLERFNEALSHFDRLGAPMPLRHLANSGGIINFPQTHFDMVRPGISLYGIYPDARKKGPLDLRPILSLKSNIVYFKVVQPNRPISYSSTWKSGHMIRVVTIPIGYGDGYRRSLSNCGEVLIGGRRYPIVGRVCMDQFMVNIEWDSAYNGDEVVLIGKQGNEEISVDDLAQKSGTIAYEILT